MAYTRTTPTIKLPSGDLVVSFFSNSSVSGATELSSAYIVELGNLVNEVEVKGGELISPSVNLSVWDKDGSFEVGIIADTINDIAGKVTFTLNSTTIFVGTIDKNSIKKEQKYLYFDSNDNVVYGVDSQGHNNPVTIISFVVNDVLSLLKNITIKSLISAIDSHQSNDNNWTAKNGAKEVYDSGRNTYYINVKQLIREIFYLLPSSVIKIGVQCKSNILNAMSCNAFDTQGHYYWGSVSGVITNVAVDKVKGLEDLYLTYNTDLTIKSTLFRPADESSANATNPPPDSIYNFNNCYELLGKILYTFGLVLHHNYSKKSIASVTITDGGSGYTNNTLISSILSGGGGTGGVIKFLDRSGSSGVLETSIITDSGSDYTTAPTIIINSPPVANQATATSTINSNLTTVSSLSITNGGGSYSSAPNVYIEPPLPSVIAIFEVEIGGGSITAINVINGGRGYRIDNLPSIDIDKPISGTKASISITSADISGGQIVSVTINSGGGGSGYSWSNPPNVYVDAPPTPIQATATSTISGGIVNTLTITNAGSGYTFIPSVYINPPTSGGVATATCSISDFDVYIDDRDGNSQSTISTSIIESSKEQSNDGYIDEYEVGTTGYTQHSYDTNIITLTQFPSSNHNNSTIFGLQNASDIYSTHTDSHLVIKAQYNANGVANPTGGSLYSTARFMHDGINRVANTILSTSTNWTLTNATHSSSGGVFSGSGKFTVSTDGSLVSATIDGSLNKIIKGDALIFSCWIRSTGTLLTKSISATILDSDNNVIEYKNISNSTLYSTQPITSNDKLFSFAFEPLDLKKEIHKIRISLSLQAEAIGTLVVSYPQVWVGAETMSRWLIDKYRKYFSNTTTKLTRKYDGLVTSDIRIGQYIIDNFTTYYIKRISKNLVDNETEIEAINYTT